MFARMTDTSAVSTIAKFALPPSLPMLDTSVGLRADVLGLRHSFESAVQDLIKVGRVGGVAEIAKISSSAGSASAWSAAISSRDLFQTAHFRLGLPRTSLMTPRGPPLDHTSDMIGQEVLPSIRRSDELVSRCVRTVPSGYYPECRIRFARDLFRDSARSDASSGRSSQSTFAKNAMRVRCCPSPSWRSWPTRACSQSLISRISR